MERRLPASTSGALREALNNSQERDLGYFSLIVMSRVYFRPQAN